MNNNEVPNQLLRMMRNKGWSATKDIEIFSPAQLKSMSKWKAFKKGNAIVTFWVPEENKIGVSLTPDGKKITFNKTLDYDLKSISRLVANMERKVVNEAKEQWVIFNQKTKKLATPKILKTYKGAKKELEKWGSDFKIADRFWYLDSIKEADSLSVSIYDFNKFTVVFGAQYDDKFGIETGEVEDPKVIINRILNKVKVPAVFKKTGRGRYDLTFRSNKEMDMAYAAFRHVGYKVTNKTINKDKKAEKALQKSRIPLKEATETFDTSLYLRSHGKPPKGRGSWVFSTSPNADIDDDRFWFFSSLMTLNDAKKEAKKHFKNKKPIFVMP